MMVASRVRRDDLTMIPSGEIDSSDYNPDRRETHIILPPLNMAGEMDPVPGSGHGFLHLMYEKVLLGDSVVTAVNEFSSDDNQVIAYPNPFKGSTSIEYQVEHQSDVEVRIYNTRGSVVETLVDKNQVPGTYRVKFNSNGKNLSAGMYIYVVSVNGNPVYGKLSLMR
jgi:hypothetical protein